MIKNYQDFVNESSIASMGFLCITLEHPLKADDPYIQELLKSFYRYNVLLKYKFFGDASKRYLSDIIVCPIESEEQVDYLLKDVMDNINVTHKFVPLTDGNSLAKFAANRA